MINREIRKSTLNKNFTISPNKTANGAIKRGLQALRQSRSQRD